MKIKVKRLIGRYLPAEIAGFSSALICSFTAHLFTKNPVILAYAASLGDHTGFYGMIIIRDSIAARRLRKEGERRYSPHDSLKITLALLLEFGGAEILDSLLIRPFLMYSFSLLLHNGPLGILIGKVTSDSVFYIIVILSPEIRKIFFRKKP
jgi:hypothetical protein